jgi:hypothetical protein
MEEAASGWFRALHEHAVVVPANDLALDELTTYNAYLCPLSSSHVGLARPRLLVMYRPGGQGLVFSVDAGGDRPPAGPGTRMYDREDPEGVRDGETLDTSQRPWTVFYLSEAGPIDKIAPGDPAGTVSAGRRRPAGTDYQSPHCSRGRRGVPARK